ncbi:alkanesulfonate monooxygenase SsuD/methylene tetrahydromethanopterin reductase-like flavin-dependent oxidoreductase (luciferase family) [Nonomuraea dietziae]|uniref:Alkanesulfonate monooxygenase SsuD/methylene tetrahydromethanopterin reductase-like flavin-dependent oxidoreductase (Luciferase family) n=1 Tax=Nonomuraea dietziae TaxID=65515 RepID=A0A7W5VIC3_9ACTN|nr:alkanesulfonate monooxygenase SsuD/methylene tetrahydromethanopterin reductase-like flavin-dependent oxidoreductase (luciferase family) [Nonomuraea dietziae]
MQRPGPPILIGGWGDRMHRLVAEQADIWYVPGPPHNLVAWIAERGRVPDDHCAAIGRDPREIVRSVQTIVSYDDAARCRKTVWESVEAGMGHIVLSLPTPHPEAWPRRLTDEIIAPVRAEL